MKQQVVLTIALLLGTPLLAQNSILRPVMAEEAVSAYSSSEASTPDADADLAQQQAPPPTTTQSEIKRPKAEGSMVGYIDDAIIGSQIRIRFDAAFNDPFPDRSEFFYGKCACYQQLAKADPAAYDPNAPGPGPGVPTNLNFQQLYLFGEYAPKSRFSVFFELPFRWIQPQGFVNTGFTPFGNQGGVSDVNMGVKLGLIDSERSALTFQFKSYLPSGNASDGLGTNHSSIEPALLLYHSFSSRWELEGQLGDWHPIDGSRGVPTVGSSSFAGDVFFYGIGPSAEVYHNSSVAIAPIIELVGWHVLGGFQTQVPGPVAGVAAQASGTNIVNMKFGVRTTIHNHNSVYVGYGRALTDADWYRDIVRVEYRYAF
jgi:hypothetical protein